MDRDRGEGRMDRRDGARMGMDRDRDERMMRRDRGPRVGVYVRGDRDMRWRHRHRGVRFWAPPARCRTIIVRKMYRHHMVVKRIRRCR